MGDPGRVRCRPMGNRCVATVIARSLSAVFKRCLGLSGGGFAMAEAAVLLTAALRQFRFAPLATPVPVSHLRVRSRDGTILEVRPR